MHFKKLVIFAKFETRTETRAEMRADFGVKKILAIKNIFFGLQKIFNSRQLYFFGGPFGTSRAQNLSGGARSRC